MIFGDDKLVALCLQTGGNAVFRIKAYLWGCIQQIKWRKSSSNFDSLVFFLKENEMQTFITNQFFILCVKRQCRN
jgi:hypothetical protein